MSSHAHYFDDHGLYLNGRLIIGPLCCCICICDPMPSPWNVTITTFCGSVSGTMSSVVGTSGCDPKWATTAPIRIDCRLDAFTDCGYPFDVTIIVCYQNGLCVISVTWTDPSNGQTETQSRSMSGTCDPFYHRSEWIPNAVAARCTTYPPTPYPIIIEMSE